MRRILAGLAALALVVGGCSSTQTKQDDRPSNRSDESGSDGDGAADRDWNGYDRLGDGVVPESYDLELTVDPTEKTFSGETRIAVDVRESTDRIRMHAENLEFSEVTATRDGEELSVDANAVKKGGLVLAFDDEVETGRITLRFEYDAPLDAVPEGLYRVRDGGNWYAYTQLEPLEAREMYPCFDEPKFKTPFTVSVTVPKGMKAAGNAPQSSREVLKGDGMVRYQFSETEPLPTYLVAIAVGEFDVVEADDVVEESERLSDVPVRVLTTKGNGDLAAYALRKTPELVRFQEEYFGIDFPYQKMDLVAVPNFAAGAMENVGLVTFRESILLVDEESASLQDEYWAQSVMAHEYAHMWFGNLVTLSWWDELWLNESFATWMGGRTVREVSPELEPEVRAVRKRSDVIQSDSLRDSRAIRQPIERGGDVYNAFSSITYAKGAAVLRMFENWMGEEAFRKGIRSYLEANRHGTGQTNELLAAFTEAAGKPVEETFGTFLNQPGAPLVRVGYDRRRCQKKGEATLELEQSRYRPIGSQAKTDQVWDIPMCIRYGGDEVENGETCVLFDGTEEKPREQTVELETEACPTWVHPNAGERGYYHWRVDPRSQQRELVKRRDALELPERVGLLGNLSAQMRAGKLRPSAYLKAMRGMAKATHRAILKKVIDSLESFDEVVYAGEPDEAFRTYVRKLLKPHYERVGFEPSEDDGPDEKLLRAGLVRAYANLGDVDELQRRAREATMAHLEGSGDVGKTVFTYAVDIAAKDGDAELWKKLRDALDDVANAKMRGEVLSALGGFGKPKLVRKSLQLFLTDEVRSQNFWRLAGSASGDPKTVDVAWKWMTDNYDAIREKLGKASAGRLPWIGSAFCSEEGAERVEEFFSKDAHRTMTTGRNLAKTLQSIRQCRKLRDKIQKPVRSELENWYQATDQASNREDGEATTE